MTVEPMDSGINDVPTGRRLPDLESSGAAQEEVKAKARPVLSVNAPDGRTVCLIEEILSSDAESEGDQ